MKIYLASFLEKSNHGKGRIISITDGSKPSNIAVNDIFLPLAPSRTLVSEYNRLRDSDPNAAGEFFRSAFEKQLDDFCDQVFKDVKETGSSIESLLPFQNQDTLCSWERKSFTHYRDLIAPRLMKLGYEVVSN